MIMQHQSHDICPPQKLDIQRRGHLKRKVSDDEVFTLKIIRLK